MMSLASLKRTAPAHHQQQSAPVRRARIDENLPVAWTLSSFGVPEVPDGAEVRGFFRHFPNVGQDKFAVTVVKEDNPLTWALTTDGLATCVAICARGVNRDGEQVLYMAHHTEVGEFAVFHALKVLCLDHGCDLSGVGLYVAGGQAVLGSDEGRTNPVSYDGVSEIVERFPTLVRGVAVPVRQTDWEAEESDEADAPGDEPRETREGSAMVISKNALCVCKPGSELPTEGRGISQGEDLREITYAQRGAITRLLASTSAGNDRLRSILNSGTRMPTEAEMRQSVPFGANAPPASERLDLVTAMLAGLDA